MGMGEADGAEGVSSGCSWAVETMEGEAGRGGAVNLRG